MFTSKVLAMNREEVQYLAENMAGRKKDKDEMAAETDLLSFMDGVPTIEISGSITRQKSLMTMLGGGTSLGAISEALAAVEEAEEIDQVLLDIDSPGGTAAGISSVTGQMRDMETETIAFASGQMLSAAYWIGSAADQVFASPNAMVGSIGVYSLVRSQSDMEKEAGIDTRVVRSTEKKAVEHPSEPISEEAVKKQQRIVDKIHENFVESVATNRNLSTEFVNDTMADGDVRVGDEAEEEGFVDGTATLDEVFDNFTFDEDSDLGRMEQENNFLRSKVSELQGSVDTLSDKLNDVKETQQESKIEGIVSKAIEEDQKFEPGKREDLKAQLQNDFEGTKKMIEMTPVDAAAPSDPVDTAEPDEPQMDEKVEKLTSRGIIPAHTEAEAEELAKIGAEFSDGDGDWFKAYEVEKYDL